MSDHEHTHGRHPDEHPPERPLGHRPGANAHPALDRFWHTVGRENPLPIDPDLPPDDPAEPSVTHHPAPVTTDGRRQHLRRLDPFVLAAIGVGGFIGTIARYGVGRAFRIAHGAFPTPTLVINTTGAFALGLLLTAILERLAPSRYLRPFACTGVLGGWTTMSTLAAETVTLLHDGDVGRAITYVVATLLAGVVATAAGIALGRRHGVPA